MENLLITNIERIKPEEIPKLKKFLKIKSDSLDKAIRQIKSLNEKVTFILRFTNTYDFGFAKAEWYLYNENAFDVYTGKYYRYTHKIISINKLLKEDDLKMNIE